uniref:Soluble scavenger receptor cysteine-rich domain-containing protein SSC5D n=1 Tax=Sinocyclocheilus anshuiensis TaxID=1608454 RepID=A0A671RY93_9TELE
NYGQFLFWPSCKVGEIVRLVGDLPSSGRVEVYHDGQWGTVCDDGWELAEAQVVCRQLGFPGAISVKPGGQYGEGSGPIWLDDMNCKGSESSLSECSFKGWGTVKKLSNSIFFLGLSHDLGLLFDSGNSCDFRINVQDTSEEEELTFCVHKMILMFYPELNITNDSRNLAVNVSQTCHPHVSAFLRYLYTRQIDVSITSAQCLHQLAFIFGVKKLMEDVGRTFTLLLPEDNTFLTQVSMYEYGVRTGDLVLQENVLQYLSWNCEYLISSPVLSTISFHMMDALLQRSDLILNDEAFLLEALETWIQDKGEEISSDLQASLLNHIRFLLIPADKLYEMQFSSSVLRQNHEKLYLTGLSEYLPRIYTGDEWSVVFNDTTVNYPYHHYGQNNRIQTFSTPAHPSALYREQKVQWQAQVFLSAQECSNYGISCYYFPVARFVGYGNQERYTSTIRYSNRLILSCKYENNVFHVQDFKNSMAVVPNNSSMDLPNPCPDDYSFRFVVRPENGGSGVSF